jgi:hypothetical protein
MFMYTGYESFVRYVACRYSFTVCSLSLHSLATIFLWQTRIVFYFNKVRFYEFSLLGIMFLVSLINVIVFLVPLFFHKILEFSF